MAFSGAVPRRCVNLPPGAFRALAGCLSSGSLQSGPSLDRFQQGFARWIGSPHAFGTASGRSAFQLALESLALEAGTEIIFPVFTFPVIPLVARLLGFMPVFCDVDPETYNAGAEQIEARITDRTGAIVATHLFGRACPISEITELAAGRNIRVIEDCAHACGVRVGGRMVGTFGDVGVFSFAEGKNMPCFGGGAIVTADEAVARRAEEILAEAPVAKKSDIVQTAVSVSMKWLLTRPAVFAATVYPMLRFRLVAGMGLMDYPVGDELLASFGHARPRIQKMSNLQASIGLLHMERIDAFNEGARRNAELLSDRLTGLDGLRVPDRGAGDHIYVYYPIATDPERRDDLRHWLLRNGIDAKTTDMCTCSALRAFADLPGGQGGGRGRLEDSLLEICVYPVIPRKLIERIASVVRQWAGPGS